MPDRLDLPTPTNGGMVIIAVVVALVVWAAVTMARAPHRCETCGHLEDATCPDPLLDKLVGTACPVCWLVHPAGACDR